MNKYLEKIASWKNPGKFMGYVTGSTKREAGARVRHMEEAIANKSTLEGLQGQKVHAERETIKARLAAGGVGVIGAAGVGYGYKKVRDKQKQETIDRYNELLKGASAGGAAKELGGSAISGVGHLLRRVGRTTVDMMNTAGGGKIKDRAIASGLKYDSKGYKSFVGAGPKDQVKHLLKSKPGSTRKDTINEVLNLHKSKRDARIALGSTAAAGISGYGWHKAREALKKNKPNYY